MPSLNSTWNSVTSGLPGFLGDFASPEVKPAGFFRRKNSADSQILEDQEAAKSGEFGEPSPQKSEGDRPRSNERLAEALRRRRRRASTENTANMKAAADAATELAEREKELAERAQSLMQGVAHHEKIASAIRSLEKEMKGRLFQIERKLDVALMHSRADRAEDGHHHHHHHLHHSATGVIMESQHSGDDSPGSPGRARGSDDKAKPGLRKQGSMLIRNMLDWPSASNSTTGHHPASPAFTRGNSAISSGFGSVADSQDSTRFKTKLQRGATLPQLRLAAFESELDSDDVRETANVHFHPNRPDHGIINPPSPHHMPEVPEPSGSPAWMESPADAMPKHRVRLARQVSMVSSNGKESAHAMDAMGNPRPRRDSWASSISSSSAEMLRAKIRAMGMKRTPRQQAIWRFMEEAESGAGATAFHWILNIIVTVNVFFCTIQTTDPPTLTGAFPVALHFFFDVFFTVEIVLRFIVCPNRCLFFFHMANWVDMAAAVPLIMNIVQCATDDCERGEMMKVVMVILPVLRLCKLLRSFEKFHLLLNAFELAFEALPVLLYTLSILVLFFSALIYFAEPRTNITTLPQAVWLTITTMMTVGYGDVMPRTTSGLICTSFLIISSALYMAIPLGIVGGAFSRVWEDRDRLMLIRRTRNRLQQWGYTPKDILELFYLYDSDKSGELDLGEFSEMIGEMRLGISADRIVNLFKTFDTDGSGKVDDEEFVRALYPKGYNTIFHIKTWGADLGTEIMEFTGFGKKNTDMGNGSGGGGGPALGSDNPSSSETIDELGAGATPATRTPMAGDAGPESITPPPGGAGKKLLGPRLDEFDDSDEDLSARNPESGSGPSPPGCSSD